MTAAAVITGWSLEPVGGAFSRAVASARGQWERREGAFLRLRDDGGREGLGEVAPLPGFSRESLEECLAAVRSAAAGLSAGGARVDEALASLPGADPGGGAGRLQEVPAARFALETALLDLASRREDVSISEWLASRAAGGNAGRSGRAPEPGDLEGARRHGTPRARASLPRSGLLAGPGDLEGARRLAGAGIRTLKVKVGVRPFPEELAGLRRLRDELGPEVALRLDAGGAWTVAGARERLAVLAAEVAPELCEEPTSGPGLLTLGATAVPWAADESLAVPGLAPRLLAAPGLAAVVLKPALLGGFGPALALARTAAARGASSLVTHLFDGPVGLAAACELALALPGPVLPCGLDPHPGLAAWPAVEVPQLREPGRVVASGRPGLGLEGVPC